MSRLVRFLAFACALLLAAVSPAAATEDPYTVKNIHVDASAVSSSEALNAAIAQGRPRAWQILYRRLSRQQDWAKQPKLDDLGIQRLMRTYTIANERRSTTRYTADVSYIFNPDQVRRLMKNTGVAYADASAHRILIIPMAPGYSKMAAWTIAWNNPRLLNGAVPLTLPVGDGLDMAILGGLHFEKATWKTIAPVASRLGSTEVALLLLNGGVVRIHHLSATPIIGEEIADVPVGGGLAGATATVANSLEDYWKMRAAIDFNHRQRATVTARFNTLGQWTSLQAALSAVPTVTGVDIVAMNTSEARLGVIYAGSLDQVQDSLARTKVALTQTNGVWSLSPQSDIPTP